MRLDVERLHQSVMHEEVHGVAVDCLRSESLAKLLSEGEDLIGMR